MIDHWCEKKNSWLGYPWDLDFCHDCEWLRAAAAQIAAQLGLLPPWRTLHKHCLLFHARGG
jgi:hypothetical protein